MSTKEQRIGEIVAANLSREAILMTDEARHYVKIGENYAGHGHVNHAAEEYVSRFNPLVHTNTVEGSFSIFKRGMRGIYQHCAKRHLHRYLAEFDFRYSNRVALGFGDVARADTLLAGVVGKGKSFLAKSLTTRSIAFGRRVYVPGDPKGEWTAVAQAVGGAAITLGGGSVNRLNPLDPGPRAPGIGEEVWQTEVTRRRRTLLGSLAEAALRRPRSGRQPPFPLTPTRSCRAAST